MHRLFLSIFLVYSTCLTAQDEFLRAFAIEICNCLDGKTTGDIATACLEELATAKSKAIRRRYDLDVSIPLQRDVLSEIMVDELINVCPLLRTVRPKNEETEFRWADGTRISDSSEPQFKSRKAPPADTASVITSEPPPVWRAAGRLVIQPGSRGLRLQTETGRELHFELPAFPRAL